MQFFSDKLRCPCCGSILYQRAVPVQVKHGKGWVCEKGENACRSFIIRSNFVETALLEAYGKGKPLSHHGILYILQNEAYKGDKLLQRQPPKDFLTKKPDKTKPYESFYLKNDHEPIVEPKVWNAVQKKIKQNMDMKEAVGHLGGRPHFLYGKVFCADCGSPMTRRTFTGYKGVKYKAWVCRDRHLGRKGNGCQMRIVKEDDLTAEICQQMNWKTVTEARMAKIDRVEVKADGVEVVRS